MVPATRGSCSVSGVFRGKMMSDHGWDSGERQVEEERISGESRRQGKQEGEEVAISTHLLESIR